MLIRKLFRFENAHIVRGCTSRRCAAIPIASSCCWRRMPSTTGRWSTTSACSRAACAS